MIQRQINFQLVMNGRNLGDLDGANQMQHVTVLGNQVAVMESFVYLFPLSIGLVAVNQAASQQLQGNVYPGSVYMAVQYYYYVATL